MDGSFGNLGVSWNALSDEVLASYQPVHDSELVCFPCDKKLKLINKQLDRPRQLETFQCPDCLKLYSGRLSYIPAKRGRPPKKTVSK